MKKDFESNANKSTVERLITAGLDVNRKDTVDNSLSGKMDAIQSNNEKAMRYFIEKMKR